ncbi:MAG: bZIP transcription factor [Pseudomonadota bacterium]
MSSVAKTLCLAPFASLVVACASNDTLPVTGERASDVNWTFADKSVLETKVSDLQTENSKLRSEINLLRRRLGNAKEVAEQAVADARAASAAAILAERGTGIGPLPQPVAEPVIAAPSADISEPDDRVPVQEAPVFDPPKFASAGQSFENEAKSPQIPLASVLWGVHLDSYVKERLAKVGWAELQRRFPDELGLLEPRLETVLIEGRGKMLRLLGGAFASEATARALCETLKAKDQYCRVTDFSGRQLSLGGAS